MGDKEIIDNQNAMYMCVLDAAVPVHGTHRNRINHNYTFGGNSS